MGADFCYVVNNPRDWATSFCLPVLVASYNADASTPPSFISPPPAPSADEEESGDEGEDTWSTAQSTAPHAPQSVKDEGEDEDEEEPWVAPFRWHWQQDGGRMEPYTDVVNELLERMHDAWRHGGGPSRACTPPIVRYVDDRPQVYEVDFVASTQRNTRTNFIRQVRREAVPVAGASRWQYVDERGGWKRYDSMVQAQIEAAFQRYLASQGQRLVRVRFPGRPEEYEVNFALGTQRNLVHGTERPVRRV